MIGFDGMDPVLCEAMMQAGRLPTLAKLANAGGYRRLGSSIPPQSPVAWANFINGAGPGSHGIFDFIQRRPDDMSEPYMSVSDTPVGSGGWNMGDYRLYLDFWPFNHRPPKTRLLRQGTPMWDYLERGAIDSVFYFLPSNYPPSKSRHGYHRSLAGLGTPDLTGNYGLYHLFHDDPHDHSRDEGGIRSFFFFENGTCHRPLKLLGPKNTNLKTPAHTFAEFLVHRDKDSRTAGIQIQGQRILLTEGQWSNWVRLSFSMSMPSVVPDREANGICRFYLLSVGPVFRLYVSPINFDPSSPAARISEPMGFVKDISDKLGPFHTVGFQEAHNARRNNVLNDAQYAEQAQFVLDERLALLDYALDDYDDGVLFFYFSSTDLQSHFFFWDGEEPSLVRSPKQTGDYMEHIRRLYERMDRVVADVLKRYGDSVTVLVMSDHGFCNFRRQFHLNAWLAENGYLAGPPGGSVFGNIDWTGTQAYGLGINALYLNLTGRERDGIVPAAQRGPLLDELARRLEAIRDSNGRQVIRHARRADQIYRGPATAMAPDLIVGYSRGYRASWATSIGTITNEVLSDNENAWSADHCADIEEVPGIFFANRPIDALTPSLVDVAPTILADFGLAVPGTMTGKDILKR